MPPCPLGKIFIFNINDERGIQIYIYIYIYMMKMNIIGPSEAAFS
jgi:hypothetical protein